MSPWITVIIPALNEADSIGATLESARHEQAAILVVDGGSADATSTLARKGGAEVIKAPRGRGVQMNRGAAAARTDKLLFLHADSRLPADYPSLVDACLKQPGIVAGAFSLAIDSRDWRLHLIAAGANCRSRLLGLPYGDQGLFLDRCFLDRAGGFPEQPIMEDFLLARRLRRLGRVATLPQPVTTSARRWREVGVIRTTLINQAVVCGYLLGIPLSTLATWYHRGKGRGDA